MMYILLIPFAILALAFVVLGIALVASSNDL